MSRSKVTLLRLFLFLIMMITALQVQVKNAQRVSVFLDELFAFGLPMSVAEGLRVGQELSAQEITDLQQRASQEAAKQLAMNFLSYRPRSSAEIVRRLQEKGFEEDIITQTISWLEGQKFVDDVAFADYWRTQRETFRPRSAWIMRQELRQKGVEDEAIAAALSGVDELENARRAVTNRAFRWADLPREAFYQKVGRYLQGRGFHWEIIQQLCDELWVLHGNEGVS